MKLHALAALVFVSACGQKQPTPMMDADASVTVDSGVMEMEPAVSYERHVRPLLERSCAQCHQSGGIGPFALTSYEQAFTFKDSIKLATERRTMPPFLAGQGCNTYENDPRLSDAEIALIGQWVAAGAPKGTALPDAGTFVPTGPQSLPRVDATLRMPQPYTPTRSPDDYRCFLLDFPATTNTYVTGFHIQPGNQKIVHHVIAYIIKPNQIANMQALDDAEAGAGWTCFGGPGGSASINQSWLGSWAPGGIPVMYPAGTGLSVGAGSKVVLQVHYNTGAAPAGASDQTAIEIATAATVTKKAYLMPWASPDWLNGAMPIPANDPDVNQRWGIDPSAFLSLVTGGQLTGTSGFRIHSASLHQHLLGTKGNLSVRHPDGTTTCLLDIPRWDFHWQRAYRLAEPTVFRRGDSLNLSCNWNNSAANQPVINGVQATPRDVNWGENTTDEMCLGIVYISEL